MNADEDEGTQSFLLICVYLRPSAVPSPCFWRLLLALLSRCNRQNRYFLPDFRQ
jgi:hypothetical protein